MTSQALLLFPIDIFKSLHSNITIPHACPLVLRPRMRLYKFSTSKRRLKDVAEVLSSCFINFMDSELLASATIMVDHFVPF